MFGALVTLLLFLLLIVGTLFIRSIIFPIPVSDTGNVRYSSIPVATITLITINSLVFLIAQAPNLYQGSMNVSSGDLNTGLRMLYDYDIQIWTYGYRDIFVHQGVSIGALAAFTSMFMHADMWHLIGNMVFLWTFGRRVEDACGSGRYLLYYLLAGIIANIGSDLLSPPTADIPGVGASGAIAGIMGAYLILFPTAMITCFWITGIVLRVPVTIILKAFGRVPDAPIFRWTIRLPAWMFLIVWLLNNTLPSIEVIQQQEGFGGVNTLAHLTGFLAALLIFLFIKKDLVTRYFTGRTI